MTSANLEAADQVVGYLWRTSESVAAARDVCPNLEPAWLWKYTHGTVDLEATERLDGVQVMRLYANPPVAQPLSEGEIVACLMDTGCLGTVRMSYETGPYQITRTTGNSDKLAAELQRACAAKWGITLAEKEKS